MSRRRRRSYRGLWIALTVLFLLGVISVISVSLWVQSYLRSDAFRLFVAAKTGQTFDAKATYGPFLWSGSSAHSDSLRVEGDPSSLLRSLSADQIRAEINWRKIFEGAWRVDEINVLRLNAEFAAGTGGFSLAPAPSAKGSASSGWLPQKFEIGRVAVIDADLAFGDAANRVAVVTGTALDIKPDGSGWVFSGSNGKLAVRTLPQFDVTKFTARTQQGAFFLTDARLRLGDSGKIAASGEVSSKNNRFNFEWEQLDVAHFLGDTWKQRLNGMLTGSGTLDLPPGQPPKASGKFLLTDGRLENIELLSQVAKFTGSPQFRRMPLQEVSGSFVYDGSVVQITGLVAESKGLMRVEGNCSAGKDGAVSGSFRIGVTPQTLQWLPGSRERVFTVARDGYLWTNVNVTGTLDNLSEDLTGRLAVAMGDQVVEEGVKILNGSPDSAVKGVKGALDLLTPLITP